MPDNYLFRAFCARCGARGVVDSGEPLQKYLDGWAIACFHGPCPRCGADAVTTYHDDRPVHPDGTFVDSGALTTGRGGGSAPSPSPR